VGLEWLLLAAVSRQMSSTVLHWLLWEELWQSQVAYTSIRIIVSELRLYMITALINTGLC